MKTNSLKRNNFITLVTGSEFTQKAILEQLRKYISDDIVINDYILDRKENNKIQSGLIVFSSKEAYEEYIYKEGKPKTNKYVVANRTVLYNSLDKILLMPKDEAVLFVNDTYESACEGIENLKSIGMNFLNYIAYYPGCNTDITCVDIAITAGELDKIPKSVKEVYDIGVRVLDFASIVRILELLNMLDYRVQKFADMYIEKVIDFAKKVSDEARENSKLAKTLRQEIVGRGYYAKYTFDDIVGQSEVIAKTKDIALKLAKTDLTILIEGDNGTGKELFASAIHNSSKRNKYPFLALNFSALPDELIESELFGYEEGSFTGAKKGGKFGIFEQANGGTIFLDEIGDVSYKMQTKLLRVLQEKEIMRVGGNKIIPVDVRIIAATNRDMQQLIMQKKMREDLYHRLKIGYLSIPKLKHRKEDISIIVEHILKIEYQNEYTIDKDVFDKFDIYDWPGNVREVINTIKYMSAVCCNNHITINDFPTYGFFNAEKINHNNNNSHKANNLDHELTLNEFKFLESIMKLSKSGEIVSKQKIKTYLDQNNYKITDYQIRKLLSELRERSYLYKSKSSYGVELTTEGIDVINYYNIKTTKNN